MSLIDNALARVVTQTPLPADWRVKRMAACDLEGIAMVELAAFKFPRSRGSFKDSLKSDHLAIVLHDGGSGVAGYLTLMPVVDEVHLLNMTVALAWQRQGLGHWLLCLVRAPTLAHGFGSLLLEVRPSSADTVAPYHRGGFAEIGRRKRYYPAENNTREDTPIMHMVCEAGEVEVA